MDKFIIQKPLVSEKSTEAAKLGKYVFLVKREVNASEVKKVVERIYGVHVMKTNALNAKPKPKHFGRHTTIRPGYKKIIITLKAGEKLDILPA